MRNNCLVVFALCLQCTEELSVLSMEPQGFEQPEVAAEKENRNEDVLQYEMSTRWGPLVDSFLLTGFRWKTKTMNSELMHSLYILTITELRRILSFIKTSLACPELLYNSSVRPCLEYAIHTKCTFFKFGNHPKEASLLKTDSER